MDKSVLVVDEDELVCWGLRRELSAQGLSVDVVARGADALDAMRGRMYDLVFLELSLPDADGLDVLSRIREMSPATRIFAVDCDASPESKEDAFSAGACQFVEKPFDVSEVVALTRSTLGDFTEKRRYMRYLCHVPLRIALVSPAPEEAAFELLNLSGTTVDVALGGLRLHTLYPLAAGQRVRVTVDDMGDPRARLLPREAAAEVVWVTDSEDGLFAGLRFLEEPGVTPDRTS